MTAHHLLKSLSEVGITIFIRDDRLILRGNLHELTDVMKADLQREKATIMAVLSRPYPNQDGMVKCCSCSCWQDHRCAHGHQVDGISLSRECDAYQERKNR